MSGNVITLTTANFDETIRSATTPVLVDFWAEWCAPCRLLAPLVENLSNEYGEKLAVCKIDIDSSPKVAARFGITSLPTLILFRDGSPVGRHVGVATPVKLRSFLSEHL